MCKFACDSSAQSFDDLEKSLVVKALLFRDQGNLSAVLILHDIHIPT